LPKKEKVDTISRLMKKAIHPKLNTECVVTCACGNSFTTISTLSTIQVEICSACHPFFTGQRKFVDTERRIDKFTKKLHLAEEKKQKADELKASKAAKKKVAAEPSKEKKSVKEILEDLKHEDTQE
jgi:large subunit ribosomal protein L31